jgi:hydroxymethylbilane synthase
MTELLRIGTRGSALALWQANHVRSRLEALGHAVELRVITTTGDRVQDRRLDSAGGKGAFLKEIEEAMVADEIDLAVHSLKDVPTTLPEGLHLVAFLERADPRDAVLTVDGRSLRDLPEGAVVGTTSLRRQCQLRAARPDLVLQDLRGNVDTRIKRLHEGKFAAILLAAAGLTRLGRAGEITELLDPDPFVPAPGQGAIALECRIGDERAAAAVQPLHHPRTAHAVAAERAFLHALHGGCNVPLGAHARPREGGWSMIAFVGREDGSAILRAEGSGGDAADLGRRLADDLLARGAGALLQP